MIDWVRRWMSPSGRVLPAEGKASDAPAANPSPRMTGPQNRAQQEEVRPRVATKGRQTTPSNSLGPWGWSVVPRRGPHAVDLERLDVRRCTAQQILDVLADLSPDVSLALHNVLRLGGRDFTLMAVRPATSTQDKTAQTALDTLVKRLNMRHGGLDGLLDQWHYTLFLQGAAAAELIVADSLKDVDDLIAVQPYTIEFRRDEKGIARPWCTDQYGQAKPLNENLFRYVPLDSPPDDPYGRAPAAPVIGEIAFGIQMMADLKQALHTNAWGRLDIEVMYEALQKAAPFHLQSDPAALWAWINARMSEIKSEYDSIRPDDTFIHLDLMKIKGVDSSGKMFAAAPLFRVLELRTIRALKQLPILMGSNEGTTETHGTVQFEIYADTIENLRAKSDLLLETLLTTALRVQGVQAEVRCEWKPLRTTDRLKDAQAEQLEIDNAIKRVSQGWTSNEEEAMRIVGHKPVGEPLPRPQPPGPKNDANGEDESEDGGEEGRVEGGVPPRDGLEVRTEDGMVEMSESERRLMRELQAEMVRHYVEWGRAFPAERIARRVLPAEGRTSGQSRAEGDEESEAERLARCRREVDAWFDGRNGERMREEERDIFFRYYLAVWNVVGRQGLAWIGVHGDFNLTNRTVIDNLRAYGAQQVTGMDRHSRDRLAHVIARSLARGNGVEQIARDIRGEFADWTTNRSRLVAHTETGEQMSFAALEFYTRNGVPMKSWLTAAGMARSGEVCSEICQRNAEAGRIPMDQPFPSGHQRPLGHPRCRCVLKPEVPPNWMAPRNPWRGQ